MESKIQWLEQTVQNLETEKWYMDQYWKEEISERVEAEKKVEELKEEVRIYKEKLVKIRELTY